MTPPQGSLPGMLPHVPFSLVTIKLLVPLTEGMSELLCRSYFLDSVYHTCELLYLLIGLLMCPWQCASAQQTSVQQSKGLVGKQHHLPGQQGAGRLYRQG